MDNNFERIFKIFSDFAVLSYKYTRKRYFYCNRKTAKKSKYWKYFIKLDKMAIVGEIKLPEYIEVQFKSSLWKGINIVPVQLFCERAKRVWKQYVNTASIKFEREESLPLINYMLQKIEGEIKHLSYIRRFFIDGVFNAELYIVFKGSSNDLIYKIFMNCDLKDFRKAAKSFLLLRLKYLKGRKEDALECNISSKLIERKEMIIRIFKGLLLYKRSCQ